MLGAIAGDIIGSVHEYLGTKTGALRAAIDGGLVVRSQKVTVATFEQEPPLVSQT
jgi:hypothetical protein